jgi:ADP-ribose pyrophosphatase YjhB (NUDIX family)
LDAALRELREETGLTDVDTNGRLLDCDVHPIPANPAKNEPAHLHFDLRYEAVANTTELTPGDDALAAKWLDLRDAGRLRDKSVRRVATWLARQRPWAERRRT